MVHIFLQFLICISTVALVAFPLPAYALPTPDALIGAANVVPLILGAVMSGLGGLYMLLRKRFGSQTSGLVMGGIFGGLIVLLGLLIFGAYSWSEQQRIQRVNSIAMYLRCDMSAHEAFIKWNRGNKAARALWETVGNFQSINLSEAEETLQAQPSATLLAVPQRSIQYHSGIPGVTLDGELKLFEYVRAKELLAYLEQVQTKDLYLHDFNRFYMRSPDKLEQDLLKLDVFKKFENIYITRSRGAKHRYVVEDNGMVRPADPKSGEIDWPVRDEPWIIDGERATFPEMLNLLSDDDVVDFIEDESVYLLAPYNSFHRHEHIQIQTYLERLLYDIPAERVLIVDMSAPDITETLNRLATKLDGQKFVVVGMTKYDWVYDGLDVAFSLWERLSHDENRFLLQGFTTRLPEASAIRFEVASRTGMIDALRQPFWQAVTWLKTTINIPAAFAVFLFAILLRLVFLPVTMLETRSRMMRSRIKNMANNKSRPAWFASSKTFEKQLHVHTGWELLGTAIMLALILPAYNILTEPPLAMLAQGWLWISDWQASDVGLSALVSVLVYAKIHLSGSSMRPRTILAITVMFGALLLLLPSIVLVYVLGVLLVTVTQEYDAAKRSQNKLNHALLGGEICEK